MEQKNKNKINSNEKTLLSINFKVFALIMSTLSVIFLCGCDFEDSGILQIFCIFFIGGMFVSAYMGFTGIIGAILLLFSLFSLLNPAFFEAILIKLTGDTSILLLTNSFITLLIMLAAGFLFVLLGIYMKHKKKKAAELAKQNELYFKMETNREYVKNTGKTPCNECKGTGYHHKDNDISTCSNCYGLGYLPETEEEKAQFDKAKAHKKNKEIAGTVVGCAVWLIIILVTCYSCNDVDEKKQLAEKKEKIKIELVENRIKWNEHRTAIFKLKNTGCDLEKQTIEFKTHGYSNGKEITRTSKCEIDFWPANETKYFEIGNSEFVDSNLDRMCFTIHYEDVEQDFDWSF